MNALFFTLQLPATVTPTSSRVRAVCHSAPYAGTVVFGPAEHLSPVFGLLRARRPAAIGWKVILVVVNAIKRQAVRAFTHISKKIDEIVPAITDSNPSAAVVFKPSVVFVTAPSKHAGPRQVCGAASINGMAVLGHDVLRQGYCAKWRPGISTPRSPRPYDSIVYGGRQ